MKQTSDSNNCTKVLSKRTQLSFQKAKK